MKIEVKELVCDWGIFIDGKLSKDLIFCSNETRSRIMIKKLSDIISDTLGIIFSVLIILIMLAFAVLVLSAFIFMISTIIGGLK